MTESVKARMQLPRAAKLAQLSPVRKISYFCLSLLAIPFRIRAALSRRRSDKALVLEPYGLGDFITLLPLLEGLRSSGWSVCVAANPYWKDVLPVESGVEFVQAHLPWTSRRGAEKYSLQRFFSPEVRETWRRMREAADGAVGFDARGDIRSVLALYLVGCRKVIAAPNYMGADVHMPWWAAQSVPCQEAQRQWQIAQHLLEGVGIRGTCVRPTIPRVSAPQEPPTIAFLPAAPWAGKLWPPDRWKDLCDRVTSRGWKAIGLCGPGQRGLAAESLGNISIIEISSIGEWNRQLCACRLAITLDSGPMHLADALNVPLIALFGAGPLPRWAPSGANSWVIHHQDDPDFQTCHHIESNAAEGTKWMRRISVDEVFETFLSMENLVTGNGSAAVIEPSLQQQE